MLKYVEPKIEHIEYFLGTVIPPHYSTSIVGTATITYKGATVKTGRVELATGTAINDEAGFIGDIKVILEQWREVEFEIKGFKISTSNSAEASYFVALRNSGNDIIKFLNTTTGQIRAETRSGGISTTADIYYDPTYRRDLKIKMTKDEVNYYINNHLLASHTTNIPSNVALNVFVDVKNLASGVARTLEFDSIRITVKP